uniref:Uncharacterized protein n=1 Tax=Megaselia scalaris TaxID=36166 RepID=T1GNZ1_MEGSC
MNITFEGHKFLVIVVTVCLVQTVGRKLVLSDLSKLLERRWFHCMTQLPNFYSATYDSSAINVGDYG